MINVDFAGETFAIPEASDRNWANLTDFLVELSESALTSDTFTQNVRTDANTIVTVLTIDNIVLLTNLADDIEVSLPSPVADNKAILIIDKGTSQRNITIGSDTFLSVNNAVQYIYLNGVWTQTYNVVGKAIDTDLEAFLETIRGDNALQLPSNDELLLGSAGELRLNETLNLIQAFLNDKWNTLIFEAPLDGSEYVRRNGSWVLNSGGSFPEAPENGELWGRKNGAWVQITGLGNAHNDFIDRNVADTHNLFKPSVDSTTSMSFQNAAGTNIFTIDSTNRKIYAPEATYVSGNSILNALSMDLRYVLSNGRLSVTTSGQVRNFSNVNNLTGVNGYYMYKQDGTLKGYCAYNNGNADMVVSNQTGGNLILNAGANGIVISDTGLVSSPTATYSNGDSLLKASEMDARYNVNTINSLLGVDTSKIVTAVRVLGYHAKGDGGGGVFIWDSSKDKALHNGGTIIDPDKVFPADWDDEGLKTTWFTGGSGSGCWVRQVGAGVDVKFFGAKGDDTTDDTMSCQQAELNTDYLIFGKTGDIFKINGSIGISNPSSFYGTHRKTISSRGGLIHHTSGSTSIPLFTSYGGLGLVGDYPTTNIVFTNLSVVGCPDIATGTVWHANTTIFDGDRLMNVLIDKCQFNRCQYIIRSWQSRGGLYAEGYIQSLYLHNCDASDCRTIINTTMAWNISIIGNKFERFAEGGIVFNLSSGIRDSYYGLRIISNHWETSGMFFKGFYGAGLLIEGNYFENNTRGLVGTYKSLIFFEEGNLAFSSFGMSISSNMFSLSSTQAADPDFAVIRFEDTNTILSSRGKGMPNISGNVCDGVLTNLKTPQALENGLNTLGLEELGVKHASRIAPYLETQISTLYKERTFAAYIYSGSKLSICSFSLTDYLTRDVDSIATDASASGSISINVQAMNAAGISFSDATIKLDFIVLPKSRGLASADGKSEYIMRFTFDGLTQLESGVEIDENDATATTVKLFSDFQIFTIEETGLGLDFIATGFASGNIPAIATKYGTLTKFKTVVNIQYNNTDKNAMCLIKLNGGV